MSSQMKRDFKTLEESHKNFIKTAYAIFEKKLSESLSDRGSFNLLAKDRILQTGLKKEEPIEKENKNVDTKQFTTMKQKKADLLKNWEHNLDMVRSLNLEINSTPVKMTIKHQEFKSSKLDEFAPPKPYVPSMFTANPNASNKEVLNYNYLESGREKTIQIRELDLRYLQPKEYLNDTIINFYLKFVENEINDEPNKVFVYSTYFFSKLYPYDQLGIEGSKGDFDSKFIFEKKYPEIRRWVKIDIFERRFLVFPINLPEHWSLFIVCNLPRLIQSDLMVDESSNDFTEEPCILYFDSLGLVDNKMAEFIRMYLNKELKTKKPELLTQLGDSWAGITDKTLPVFQPLVPKQQNLYDCGLYLLAYVELFMMDPSYILKDLQNLIKIKWFPRSFIREKRVKIDEFIQRLANTKFDKKKIIKQYIEKRKELLEKTPKNSESEFDEFDEASFKNYLKERGFGEDFAHMHRARLDFYMNPCYNKYEE